MHCIILYTIYRLLIFIQKPLSIKFVECNLMVYRFSGTKHFAIVLAKSIQHLFRI